MDILNLKSRINVDNFNFVEMSTKLKKFIYIVLGKFPLTRTCVLSAGLNGAQIRHDCVNPYLFLIFENKPNTSLVSDTGLKEQNSVCTII